jgi:hypothetical protein
MTQSAPPGRSRLAPHGPDDQMVAGFIDRVAALPPAEWERLAQAYADGGSLASDMLRAVDRALHRLQRSPAASRWDRQRTVRFHALADVLDQPHVAGLARSRVLTALLAVRCRDLLQPELVRRTYAFIEPFIPWSSLPGAEPGDPRDPSGGLADGARR